MKKSYNPFKMWGSYVGALLGFMIPTNCYTSPKFTLPLTWICQTPEFTYWIKLTFLGFLIGWLINSLWRKFR